MALVDYASSSGEEESRDGGVSEAETVEEQEIGMNTIHGPHPSSLPPPSLPPNHSSSSSFSLSHPNRTNSAPSMPTHVPFQSAPYSALPDASLLFSSPGINHSSRFSEATNTNSSKKRDSNGTAHQFLQNKAPRVSRVGILRSRNMADRSTSLVPPQLRGRSNVATEDISKLFVHRRSGNP